MVTPKEIAEQFRKNLNTKKPPGFDLVNAVLHKKS